MSHERQTDLLEKTLPPGQDSKTRTLNVEIPEEIYWHVRKCATDSRLSVKDYMAVFCKEAKPIE